MELVERYLQTAKFFLPKSQQDDIVAELSENIQSQVEEKEAELGRTLNEEEQTALIRQLGHPILLALRYRPGRHLIGPVVFPFYLLAVQIILVVVAIGYAFNAILMLIGGKTTLEVVQPVHMLQAVFDFGGAALRAFGWMTLLFAILDWSLERFHLLDRWNATWDPRSLPPLQKQAPRKEQPESVFGFVATVVFGVWWLVGLKFPFLLLGPVTGYFTFGPVWATLYPFVVVLTLAGIAQSALKLWRPQETPLRTVTRLIVQAGELVLLYLLIRNGNLILLADPPANPVLYGGVAAIINACISLGLSIALAISSIQFAWECLRQILRALGREGRGWV